MFQDTLDSSNAVTSDTLAARADHHLAKDGEDHPNYRHAVGEPFAGNSALSHNSSKLETPASTIDKSVEDNASNAVARQGATDTTGGKGTLQTMTSKIEAGTRYTQVEDDIGQRVGSLRRQWEDAPTCEVVLTINSNGLKHIEQQLKDKSGPLIQRIRDSRATRLYFIESHDSHSTFAPGETQAAALKADLEACFQWPGCWLVVLATHGNCVTNTAAVKYAGVCACIFIPHGGIAPTVYTGCLTNGTPTHIEGKQHSEGRWALVMNDNNPRNLFDHLLIYANNSGNDDDRAAYKLATLHQIHRVTEWHQHTHPGRILVQRGDPNAIRLQGDTVLQVGGKFKGDLHQFLQQNRHNIACLRERESRELETLLMRSYSSNPGVDLLEHFDRQRGITRAPTSTTFNLTAFKKFKVDLYLGARIDHVIAHGALKVREAGHKDGLGPFGVAIAEHPDFPANALSSNTYNTDHAPVWTVEVTTTSMLEASREVTASAQGSPCAYTQGYKPLPAQRRRAGMALVEGYLVSSCVRQIAPHLLNVATHSKHKMADMTLSNYDRRKPETTEAAYHFSAARASITSFDYVLGCRDFGSGGRCWKAALAAAATYVHEHITKRPYTPSTLQESRYQKLLASDSVRREAIRRITYGSVSVAGMGGWQDLHKMVQIMQSRYPSRHTDFMAELATDGSSAAATLHIWKSIRCNIFAKHRLHHKDTQDAHPRDPKLIKVQQRNPNHIPLQCIQDTDVLQSQERALIEFSFERLPAVTMLMDLYERYTCCRRVMNLTSAGQNTNKKGTDKGNTFLFDVLDQDKWGSILQVHAGCRAVERQLEKVYQEHSKPKSILQTSDRGKDSQLARAYKSLLTSIVTAGLATALDLKRMGIDMDLGIRGTPCESPPTAIREYSNKWQRACQRLVLREAICCTVQRAYRNMQGWQQLATAPQGNHTILACHRHPAAAKLSLYLSSDMGDIERSLLEQNVTGRDRRVWAQSPPLQYAALDDGTGFCSWREQQG